MLLKEAFQVPNLKTGKMEPLISALTEKEEEQFKNMLTRIHTIMQAAKDLDVRVMIDAEQTYFQPAITRLVIRHAPAFLAKNCSKTPKNRKWLILVLPEVDFTKIAKSSLFYC